MATDGILKDVGAICDKLVNHRAALHQEIQHFVKEFETRRGDTDLQALQVALKKTDDMNEEYMPAIKYHGKLLDLCVKEVVEATTACQIVITEGEVELQKTLSRDDLNTLASSLQQYREGIDKQRSDFDAKDQEEKGRLREKLIVLEEEKRRLLGKVDSVPQIETNGTKQEIN
jgi:hypothetical protein